MTCTLKLTFSNIFERSSLSNCLLFPPCMAAKKIYPKIVTRNLNVRPNLLNITNWKEVIFFYLTSSFLMSEQKP